ncbi:hypothetical protein ACFY7C_37110 [Streptomyces sp. NPDC012769]|uniref:hypothetical protein n=1 Tax=Streptomyces sp. NPDC012769 TaxID=3364848 RepID=UPI0036C1EFC6
MLSHKTLVSALSATVLAAGLALTAAGPASAASCPSSASPVIPGAKAHWTLRCSGTTLKVYGWVEDTRADGDCAFVHVHAGNGGADSADACGWGTRTNFDMSFPRTNTAEARLQLEN